MKILILNIFLLLTYSVCSQPADATTLLFDVNPKDTAVKRINSIWKTNSKNIITEYIWIDETDSWDSVLNPIDSSDYIEHYKLIISRYSGKNLTLRVRENLKLGLFDTTHYSYDQNDSLIKKIMINGNEKTTWLYKYDKQKRMILRTLVIDETDSIFTRFHYCNNSSSPCEKQFYATEKKDTTITKYRYNYQGKAIIEIEESSPQPNFKTLIYNNKGLLSQELSFYKNQEHVFQTWRNYYPNGRLKEIIDINPETREVISIQKFEYQKNKTNANTK